MGNRFFSKVQYGSENPAARGTPVPATKVWPGQALQVLTDVQTEMPVEQFALRMDSRRAIEYETYYQSVLSSTHAGFQQLLPLFGGGLKGAVSPTNGGAGDYTWVFTPSLTAANNPDSLTLEFGDDYAAYRVPYCLFDRITIKGDIAQDGGASPVSVEGSFFGRTIAANAFTGSLAINASTPMNAKKARLYVDTAWAGVGVTEFALSLRGFQIEILTGLHPAFTGSANTYFDTHKEGVIGYSATFTIEGGANAAAAFAAQKAGSLQVVRFQILGPQIGAGGYHTLTLDMGGVWENVTPVDGEDRGDNLATLAFKGMYDDTGAKGLVATVLTNQAVY